MSRSTGQRARATTKRRPGGRTAAVSTRIHDAALALLAEQGYAAFALADLAARAEVNRTTLYRRWPTKAALILDAIALRIEERIVIPDTGSLRDDLTAMLAGLSAFLRSPVGRAALAAALEIGPSAGVAGQWQRLWRRRLGAIEPDFARARARGEMAADQDTEALLAAAAGAIYFRLFIASRPANAAWIGRVVALLLHRTRGKTKPAPLTSR